MSHEIDLSGLDPEQRERWRGRMEHLPPGIRESLRKNLARIPPDKVARILRENEGTISRLEDKLGGAARKAADAGSRLPEKVQQFGSKGHYNNTVQAGDGDGLSLVPMAALALALALGGDWLVQVFGG